MTFSHLPDEEYIEEYIYIVYIYIYGNVFTSTKWLVQLLKFSKGRNLNPGNQTRTLAAIFLDLK